MVYVGAGLGNGIVVLVHGENLPVHAYQPVTIVIFDFADWPRSGFEWRGRLHG